MISSISCGFAQPKAVTCSSELDPNDPRQAQGVAAIVHLLVESAERLVLPGPRLRHSSRDFH
jgi:hypothetical protein